MTAGLARDSFLQMQRLHDLQAYCNEKTVIHAQNTGFDGDFAAIAAMQWIKIFCKICPDLVAGGYAVVKLLCSV